MSKKLQERVKEAAGDEGTKFKIINGEELAEVDIVRLQVEGEKDSGKSTFVLSILRHLTKVQKMPPEAILMCVIDFDKRGIGRLLKRNIVSKELQKRILYWKTDTIMDAYDAWDYMKEQLEAHVKKWGTTAGAWIIIENTGQMWDSTQDYYSRAVEGMPMRELLLRKKKAAKAEGKVAFSLFDNPRDSYKVINPLHNNLRNSITNSDFNIVFTCHLKAMYGSKETNDVGEVIGYRGEGQKKNEGDMDFVIRCHLDHKNNRHYKELRTSKDTDNKFKKEFNINFTGFWKWIYDMMEREGKKYKRPPPDRYWETPIKIKRAPKKVRKIKKIKKEDS